VLFDLGHPAHINLYKNFIKKLDAENIQRIVSVLDRGKVVKIAKKELAGKKIYISGKHRGTLLSIIFEANLLKFLKLLWIILKERPTIGFGTGYLLGGAMFLFNKKCYLFEDDPERKWVVFLEKHVSTQVYFPPIISDKGEKKISIFRGLKEWAYLSPTYFTPNPSVLESYGLVQKNYVFIREVSSGSVNYMGQSEGLILSVSHTFRKDLAVVLSLENKELKSRYPEHWIILEEPVMDIHSLIYYSRVLVSSGDSMAREGAMLGVPSIYCGYRTMKANEIMEKYSMLFHVDYKLIARTLNDLFAQNEYLNNQDSFRDNLKNEWVDLPAMMYNLIEK